MEIEIHIKNGELIKTRIKGSPIETANALAAYVIAFILSTAETAEDELSVDNAKAMTTQLLAQIFMDGLSDLIEVNSNDTV